MNEHHGNMRREPRIDLPKPLNIYNNFTEELIGQLVNLSPSGFMLTSPKAIPDGTVLQLRVDIEKKSGEGHSVQVGAESLWQKASHNGHQHWSGFRILDISPQDTQFIQELVAESMEK
ncbi:PilZ domain-containing protein [Sansalvadorimonas verongulae]|uniref:PilZ domain-containing protein n=1 Tax=Sansalvadorimonas verongulae TaxID=2172824 RepID=UPI0012BD7255|nr:PilZ domain-containing protein [Sansalvadorimonas verongulae]MTI15222.1 PilZ domain-containing protein [Sansalvadorimonas verongulae]